MLFSTKAEYGVRLMVELGRRNDGEGSDVQESSAAINQRRAMSRDRPTK